MSNSDTLWTVACQAPLSLVFSRQEYWSGLPCPSPAGLPVWQLNLGLHIAGKILYNNMGKTRDLFKKIRDTKGTFHAKVGLIKDRNGMDLTEAEDIKKRWQEYTEKLYKKIFMTQIITMV